MSLTKTIYPKLVTNYYTSNLSLLSAYTNFIELNKNYTKYIQTSINFELSDAQSDFVTSDSNFYTKLNTNFETFDLEFIDYWKTEYNKTISQIKDITGNTKFFQPLSDTIGLLINSINCLDDTTINIKSGKLPLSYSTNISNKLSVNTLKLTKELSYKTSHMFYKNVSNINLNTDTRGYDKVVSYISTLNDTLNKNFDKVYKLVNYYSNINNNSGYNPNNTDFNKQEITQLIVKQNVEGVIVSTSLLGKKIKVVESNKTLLTLLGAKINNTTQVTTQSIDSQLKPL